MKTEKDHSLKARLKSFSYAYNGLKLLFLNEPNAKIHLLISVIVICCGFLFKVSLTEWCLLLFAIGLVISTEMLNTAIEKLADTITTERNPQIGVAKDIAAGAVLFSVIIAVIIGLIVFIF